MVNSAKTSTFAAQKAQMAESVDALVSNTSGATHPGSIPGLGTEAERVEKPLRFFVFLRHKGGLYTLEYTGSAELKNKFIKIVRLL